MSNDDRAHDEGGRARTPYPAVFKWPSASRLGAAVKHDDEGKGLSSRAARDEQLVGSNSGRAAECAGNELRPVGRDIRHGRRSAQYRASQTEASELLHVVQRRGPSAPLRGSGPRGWAPFLLPDQVGLHLDGRRLQPRWRRRARAIKRFCGSFTPEHALQKRSGLDQLARTRETSGLMDRISIQHLLYLVLSARAALTAGVAWRAPSTETDAMVARARSGVTSWAMVAKPRTLMCSISPAR